MPSGAFKPGLFVEYNSCSLKAPYDSMGNSRGDSLNQSEDLQCYDTDTHGVATVGIEAGIGPRGGCHIQPQWLLRQGFCIGLGAAPNGLDRTEEGCLKSVAVRDNGFLGLDPIQSVEF